MPKIQKLFFILGIYFLNTLTAKQLETDIATPYAILINAKTGQVLFQKQADESIYPASTTKIATALYVLKTIPDSLDHVIQSSYEALKRTTEKEKKDNAYDLPAYWLEEDGASVELNLQDKLSLKSLLSAALIASGNDAANVVAEYACGDIASFTENINCMVKNLGCMQTHFCNPHGLHHPNHVSSAKDMSMIAKEALQYPQFKDIVKMQSYEHPISHKVFKQINLLLDPESPYFYEKAFGIKTGTTKASKYNLVAAAENEERCLIVVLHKSPTSKDRYQDAICLFETAFQEEKEKRMLFAQKDTKFNYQVPETTQKSTAQISQDAWIEFFPSEEEEFETKIIWKDLYLPISLGEEVGHIEVIGKDSASHRKIPLYANQTLQESHFIQIKKTLCSLQFLIWTTLWLGLFLYVKKIRKNRYEIF